MVAALVGLALYSSFLRVTSSNANLDAVYEDDFVDNLTQDKLGEFSFLVKFAVELFLAWFVFFPLATTIAFAGLLSCNGRVDLPFLGGRQRDKRLLDEKLNKEFNASISKFNSKRNTSRRKESDDGLCVNNAHSFASSAASGRIKNDREDNDGLFRDHSYASF